MGYGSEVGHVTPEAVDENKQKQFWEGSLQHADVKEGWVLEFVFHFSFNRNILSASHPALVTPPVTGATKTV